MTREEKGALFSECGQSRYFLFRIWDRSKPLLMFIGLNPSTATEHTDDPTIKRIFEIAKSNDAGGFYMVNLFSIITPYPKVLYERQFHPSGDKNVEHVMKISKLCKRIVFAWGNFDTRGRDAVFQRAFGKTAWALHINKNGSPKHPLYCRKDSQLIKYQTG